MRKIVMALAILCIGAFGANAQTTVDNLSGATSQAIAIAGGGSGSGTNDGTIRQRLTTTPTVIPPSMQGANPCTVGASGGVSVMGFGGTAGVMTESRRCRGQEWFRFQMMAGNREAAQAIACITDEDMREAYRQIGQPCPADRAAQTTARPTTQPVIAQPVAQQVAAAARPAWCDTTSAAELRRYPQCNR